MLSAVARHSLDIDEPAIRLVHEPRRVQRVFKGRAPQALVSERSQRLVEQRYDLAEHLVLAATPTMQQLRHVVLVHACLRAVGGVVPASGGDAGKLGRPVGQALGDGPVSRSVAGLRGTEEARRRHEQQEGAMRLASAGRFVKHAAESHWRLNGDAPT
jgi:hypothetical protein